MIPTITRFMVVYQTQGVNLVKMHATLGAHLMEGAGGRVVITFMGANCEAFSALRTYMYCTFANHISSNL